MRTVVFCALVSTLALSVAMLLAVFADREIKGRGFYRTLLIWPYAVAPAVAAVLWIMVLHPQIGLLGRWLNRHGIPWDYKLNGNQALLVTVLASAWKQVSYNFVFFLAGLQAIPRAVLEAARIDGAREFRVFRAITFPLLMPTVVFLLVVNLVYSAFETFGTIQALTGGGPGKATETLGRESVPRRRGEPGPGRVRGAVRSADAGRDRADRAAIPLPGRVRTAACRAVTRSGTCRLGCPRRAGPGRAAVPAAAMARLRRQHPGHRADRTRRIVDPAPTLTASGPTPPC